MNIVKNIRYIINAYIALFIYIFTKKRDNLWVIGGHNGTLYTDNAKVFYEYIVDNHSDIEIYWFVNRDATIHNQIRAKMVTKGSIKGYLYFYNSNVTLFSNTLNLDIAPFAFILPFVRGVYSSRYKVYLSHGTIAFKKMPKYSGAIGELKRAIFKSYNLAIASTSLEKRAMVEYGVDELNISILGSARNDRLESIKSSKDTILIAPTWRGWLSREDTLIGSKFLTQYSSFLSDARLQEYLQNHNIYIEFYLHHMFHKFYSEFLPYSSSHISILKPDANISKSIMSSKLLITDYSSICADFYYLKKPVIFFQFDRDEYIQKVGSEIDLVDNQFGDISYSVDEMIDRLVLLSQKEFKVSAIQEKGEKYFVNFVDRDNCRRIYDMILQKLSGEL